MKTYVWLGREWLAGGRAVAVTARDYARAELLFGTAFPRDLEDIFIPDPDLVFEELSKSGIEGVVLQERR